MSTTLTAVAVIAVMAGVGLIFGFVLAYVNKKFVTEVNPLIHIVEDILPKAQCGACGFPGCAAYAQAVVTDPDVQPNRCVPGRAGVAKLVAELTGKAAAPPEALVAHVKCGGMCCGQLDPGRTQALFQRLHRFRDLCQGLSL